MSDLADERVQRKCSKYVTKLGRRMEELSENFNRVLENIRKKKKKHNQNQEIKLLEISALEGVSEWQIR